MIEVALAAPYLSPSATTTTHPDDNHTLVA